MRAGTDRPYDYLFELADFWGHVDLRSEAHLLTFYSGTSVAVDIDVLMRLQRMFKAVRSCSY